MKLICAALAIFSLSTAAWADDDGLADCLDGQLSIETNQQVAIPCDYALRNAPMDQATRARVHLRLGMADAMHVLATKISYLKARTEGNPSAADSALEILNGSYERSSRNLEQAAALDNALAPQATYVAADAAARAMKYSKADSGLTTLIERGQDVWTGYETLRLHHLYHQRGKVRCSNGQPVAALADIKKGIEVGGADTARYWQQTLASFKQYDGAMDATYNAVLEAAFKKAIQGKDLFVCY